MPLLRSKSQCGLQDRLTVSKTCLQEVDFEVTKKLRRVKFDYEHYYKPVHNLAEKFEQCTCNYRPALVRYIKMKSMINECISECREKTETVYDLLDTTGDIRDLKRKTQEISTIRSDYKCLHKAELKPDISEKKKEIQRLLDQTKCLKDAVEGLQREFNIARNYGMITRYKLYKEMIMRTIEEMRKCHNPEFEIQWVDKNRDSTEQTFFYLRDRSASF